MLIHLETVSVHLVSKLIEYPLSHKAKSLQILLLCGCVSAIDYGQVSVLCELAREKAKCSPPEKFDQGVKYLMMIKIVTLLTLV